MTMIVTPLEHSLQKSGATYLSSVQEVLNVCRATKGLEMTVESVPNDS